MSAQQAKEAAIAKAEAGAGDAAIDQACLDVRCLRSLQDEFTTDDVFWTVTFPEPRAIGAVMTRLKSQGHIEPTNQYRSSNSTKCHARPKRVWRFI